MKKYFLLFFSIFMLVYQADVYSQKSSSKKKSSKKEEMGSSAQKNFGVGLRIGDPLGLTLKKYFGDKLAIEFNLGKTYFWGSGYDGYYRYYNKKNPPPYPYYSPAPGPGPNPYYAPVAGNPYYYNGYYFYNPNAASMQLHILAQKTIPSVTGLQLYFGGGPQLRILSYKYGYYYDAPQGRLWYSDTYTQAGFGLDGVFGTEYTFSGLPLTVFADINLYAEITPVPLWLGIQGGIGARFNF